MHLVYKDRSLIILSEVISSVHECFMNSTLEALQHHSHFLVFPFLHFLLVHGPSLCFWSAPCELRTENIAPIKKTFCSFVFPAGQTTLAFSQTESRGSTADSILRVQTEPGEEWWGVEWSVFESVLIWCYQDLNSNVSRIVSETMGG